MDNLEGGVVYRLALADQVADDAWRTRLQWTTAFVGVAGLDNKFIHCSTAEQLADTAAANFAGKVDVVLLQFSVSLMREEADLDVRWEDGAPPQGSNFPHVYGGPIPYACLAAPPNRLELSPTGEHVFPPLGQRTVGAVEVGVSETYNPDHQFTMDHNPDAMYTEDEVLDFERGQDAEDEANEPESDADEDVYDDD